MKVFYHLAISAMVAVAAFAITSSTAATNWPNCTVRRPNCSVMTQAQCIKCAQDNCPASEVEAGKKACRDNIPPETTPVDPTPGV